MASQKERGPGYIKDNVRSDPAICILNFGLTSTWVAHYRNQSLLPSPLFSLYFFESHMMTADILPKIRSIQTNAHYVASHSGHKGPKYSLSFSLHCSAQLNKRYLTQGALST